MHPQTPYENIDTVPVHNYSENRHSRFNQQLTPIVLKRTNNSVERERTY